MFTPSSLLAGFDSRAFFWGDYGRQSRLGRGKHARMTFGESLSHGSTVDIRGYRHAMNGYRLRN
jgi:hypothetical protein